MAEFNDEVEFGAISEDEKRLAAEALNAFRDGDTSNTLSKLNQLREKRPKDVKVLHNYLIASSETPSSLLTSLESLITSPDCDEVDSCVTLLNVALLHFRQQRFHQAQELLEKLMMFVEPLGEALYRDALFLYMETCLKLNYPEKVPKLIATLEGLLFGRVVTPRSGSSSPQESRDRGDKNLEWKPVVNQYRVRCLLALRSLKACKREIKNLNGEDRDSKDQGSFSVAMSAFVRAQLEQQRDSGKKAVKILSTLHGKSILGTRHLATIYYNNMAAIHFKAGKSSLAVMYAQHALDEYARQMACGEPHQTRMFFDLLYNLGVCKLFCGSAKSAFEDLAGCVQLMGSNPQVWMRLAECGLVEHHKVASQGRKKIVNAQVGQKVHERILLAEPTTFHNVHQQFSNEQQMRPTLDLALRALKICLALIVECELSLTAMETPGDGTPCASSLQELRLLNNSALCASAYASLCMGDFAAAQEFCEMLLIQDRLSGAQRVLAHLYCAEALLMQDQLSEAVDHLSLNNAEQLAVLPPSGEANETQWGTQINMDWLPPSNKCARLMFQYNLAVAFALREELHKAEEALRPLLEQTEKTDEPLGEHVLWLAIYLNLQQGRPDQAKQLIYKCQPIVQYARVQ
ncbi:CCR4-NOT transcription complex subunit 10-like isoform X1 [Varroa destructor]|uniref:CCR4-NOT transcription complex subunit 10 n=1 Tax=Varroa destructor TaxID=109461 RepID=A0A7M7KBP4_VARDE|nr:CCR4-NOT transcription complex subunit 10-like isoform X1 [Varroa destructor]XP_022663828.1 CCR4-NOT transcription complex subunit 10-like isoform X1 [Varroa destructor]XP_022663829.1 CCR4-NOT transcription complex subunit 10-like isoform X1 [Varroa destructor]